MREQQIDASQLARQVVLQHAAIGVGGFRVAEQPLEVADIAVDRHTEIRLALVAARNLVERRLALDRVDVPAQHATLSRPEALPHVGRGPVVDGAGNLVEPELAAALRRRGRLRAEAGAGIALLRHIRGVAELTGKSARNLTDIAVRRADRPSPRVETGQRTEVELGRRGLKSRLRRGLEGLRARLRRGLAERVRGRGRGLRRSGRPRQHRGGDRLDLTQLLGQGLADGRRRLGGMLGQPFHSLLHLLTQAVEIARRLLRRLAHAA